MLYNINSIIRLFLIIHLLLFLLLLLHYYSYQFVHYTSTLARELRFPLRRSIQSCGPCRPGLRGWACRVHREGVMIRLETLIELQFLNSRVFRACPLIEIRQTVPGRAIRGNSISVSSTLPSSSSTNADPPGAAPLRAGAGEVREEAAGGHPSERRARSQY